MKRLATKTDFAEAMDAMEARLCAAIEAQTRKLKILFLTVQISAMVALTVICTMIVKFL